MKEKVTRAEAGEHLARFHLSCELLKVIRHFFPGLLSLLKQIRDPRDQRYITYQGQVLLMTKILSSIFYISSMRKTSEEFNSEAAIENIGHLSGQGKYPFYFLTDLPVTKRSVKELSEAAPFQPQLPGMEKSLLPDTDRPYDFTGHRGMGEIMGKSEAEQGAEAPEAAGSMETGAAERMHDRREVPGEI